jgi:predicted Zn finger-like uncharacterized protein
MPITLNCPKCHKPFRVRDESIGGRVRCPSCGSVLQVPSALSPASNFGDEPKSEGAAVAGGPRPVAEDVPPGGSRAAAMSDLMLGGPGRRDEAVDMNPQPGGMAGPPSIKGLPPMAPGRAHASKPQPAAPIPPAPMAPPPAKTAARGPVRLPLGGGDPAWGRVHGGLGMIRWGLWFCALIFLGAFAHGAWCVLDTDGALKDGPGFLQKEGWPRWKEILVAYTAGPLVFAIPLLLLGRLRCCRAPAEAHARGLACGATFFTLVALLGAAVYVGLTYFDLADKLADKVKVPPQTRMVALIATIPSAILADVLTLFFVGQLGWPLNRPGLQRSAAGVFVYAGVLPAAILIGHLFYPAYDAAMESLRQSGSPLGAGDDSDLARRVMIWSVIILSAGLLFFLRYAAVAGAGRRAIRRYLAGQA